MKRKALDIQEEFAELECDNLYDHSHNKLARKTFDINKELAEFEYDDLYDEDSNIDMLSRHLRNMLAEFEVDEHILFNDDNDEQDLTPWKLQALFKALVFSNSIKAITLMCNSDVFPANDVSKVLLELSKLIAINNTLETLYIIFTNGLTVENVIPLAESIKLNKSIKVIEFLGTYELDVGLMILDALNNTNVVHARINNIIIDTSSYNIVADFIKNNNRITKFCSYTHKSIDKLCVFSFQPLIETLRVNKNLTSLILEVFDDPAVEAEFIYNLVSLLSSHNKTLAYFPFTPIKELKDYLPYKFVCKKLEEQLSDNRLHIKNALKQFSDLDLTSHSFKIPFKTLASIQGVGHSLLKEQLQLKNAKLYKEKYREADNKYFPSYTVIDESLFHARFLENDKEYFSTYKLVDESCFYTDQYVVVNYYEIVIDLELKEDNEINEKIKKIKNYCNERFSFL